MEVRIKNTKHDNKFDVTLKDFTAGMILAIKHALSVNTTPVGQDVLDFLKRAIDKNEKLKERLG